MRDRNITVVEATSELGAGTRGSSLGPSALRLADINKGGNLINKYPQVIATQKNQLIGKPTPYRYAKNIDHVYEVLEGVAKAVQETLALGGFPLVLSADHSNAAGTIAGIREQYPNQRLGVVWIDAHADLHSPYTTPSGNIHGMPLAIALGEDNIEDKINDLDEGTIAFWEKLKRVGPSGKLHKINPEDLVFIDIRDLEKQEWDLIDEKDIRFYTPKERKEKGIDIIAKEVVEYLAGCDMVYISFDVDSLDPTVSKGTGTSYPNGLHLHEAKTLLYHLLKSRKTVAFEITEINPLLDNSNKMAKSVLEILEEVM